jgi:hypothetical protein
VPVGAVFALAGFSTMVHSSHGPFADENHTWFPVVQLPFWNLGKGLNAGDNTQSIEYSKNPFV